MNGVLPSLFVEEKDEGKRREEEEEGVVKRKGFLHKVNGDIFLH